jgi:preprotein translocase subunit SecE
VQGSRVELRKVVWPTRQETLQTALVVFIAITAMGLFFWMLDWVLGALTRALTGQGG